MSAEQQLPERREEDKIKERQEEIRRRDVEIANIEWELRKILEVMRRRNVPRY